jgi:hypothetical protein
MSFLDDDPSEENSRACITVLDLPDNVAAASLVTAVGASGLVRARTTPLLTVGEMDKALAKNIIAAGTTSDVEQFGVWFS